MDFLDFGVLLPPLPYCLNFIAFQDLDVWESVILSDAELAATWFTCSFQTSLPKTSQNILLFSGRKPHIIQMYLVLKSIKMGQTVTRNGYSFTRLPWSSSMFLNHRSPMYLIPPLSSLRNFREGKSVKMFKN